MTQFIYPNLDSYQKLKELVSEQEVLLKNFSRKVSEGVFEDCLTELMQKQKEIKKENLKLKRQISRQKQQLTLLVNSFSF